MLKKNVYLLYSPGYAGNFLNWAINSSDAETRLTTVDNPINNSTSEKLGGAGTSHLHTRIPTHQGLHHHMAWMLLNKPTAPQVYCIGAENFMVRKAISHVVQFDNDAVFVSIHNNRDENIDMFGTINMITKWPTFLDVKLALQQDRWGRDLVVPKTIDPYNCKDDRDFRNWIVEHHDDAIQHNEPINYSMLDKDLKKWSNWYLCRSRVQPHEVNEQYYLGTRVSIENRVFEISVYDICSGNLIPWLENFMQVTNCSDDYSLDNAKKVYPQYVEAQKNLQWFSAIKNWEDTGELDTFLTSHAGIEALVIVKMLRRVGNLGIDWKNMSLEEINLKYQDSMNDIQLYV